MADEGQQKVEMPAPTVSPFVLALGIALIFAGPVLSWAMTVAGFALLVAGIAGWVGQMTSSEGQIEEPVVAGPKPIQGVAGRVEILRPGMPGYRARLPEKMHPYSAGFKGGLVGGVLMTIPALAFGVIRYGSIWFPVNLLAGMVLPELVDETLPANEQLEYLKSFHLGLFSGAVLIHAVISGSLGLMYGVMLPTLPGRPIIWGGIVLPLLWTGFSYGFMGVLNPILHDHVDWLSFIVSQFVFGIAAAIVVARSEQIPA